MLSVLSIRKTEMDFISARVLGDRLHKTEVSFRCEHPRRCDIRTSINTSETDREQLEPVFTTAEGELTYLMGVSCYPSRGGLHCYRDCCAADDVCLC
jgi:hypothetical protein